MLASLIFIGCTGLAPLYLGLGEVDGRTALAVGAAIQHLKSKNADTFNQMDFDNFELSFQKTPEFTDVKFTPKNFSKYHDSWHRGTCDPAIDGFTVRLQTEGLKPLTMMIGQ